MILLKNLLRRNNSVIRSGCETTRIFLARGLLRCPIMMVRTLILPLATALVALAWLAVSLPVSATDNRRAMPPIMADSKDLCRIAAAKAEYRWQIPRQLLTAVSLAESGRWNGERREITAWPWTVYAEGQGHYMPDKQAAIRKVRALRAKGIRNIDVGCMQVNLHYHGDAFDSLAQAFDPARNANYAARFMKDLHGELKSWTMAAGTYHSRTPHLNRAYRAKVKKLWNGERKRFIRLLREQRRKRMEARAEARQAARNDNG
jgi:hypothetical protein